MVCSEEACRTTIKSCNNSFDNQKVPQFFYNCYNNLFKKLLTRIVIQGVSRAGARALMGGYSYIRVMPD